MNRGRDEVRIKRLNEQMRQAGLDFLVLRLPENVLYATGYWPIFGASMAVVPVDGEATIFYIDGEQVFVADGWVADARPYKYFDLEQMANPNRSLGEMLVALWKERGYHQGATIGYEGSFELVAANNIGAEVRVPAESGLDMLRRVLPKARLLDAFSVLRTARLIKSQAEVEMMRLANEIACQGYAAAREVMIPGLKDAEVSAAVEARIYGRGVGYKGLRRARGFCYALSGPNSAMGENPYFISSPRTLARGDVVLVELDTFADGYFSDLSRTMCVGEPNSQAQEVWGVVNEALEAMLSAIKPGVPARELNRLAWEIVKSHGYPEGFVHHAGHGIGLQFHEPPTLHPASDELLAEGMVISLEPHCYVPGWGGVRIEENVVVTRTGYELLSIYPRQL